MSPSVMPPRPLCLLVTTTLITIPLALLIGTGWYWLAQRQALDNEIAQRTATLQGYQRILRTLPALRAELERVNANDELKSLYFDASTPALAGAALQRQLQELVQGAGGRLISTQLLPAAPDDDPPQVRIRTQLQGTIGALLDVLLEIEQARPLLFVDQVSIRSTARTSRANRSRRSARRSTSTRDPGTLTVRLDVFGYTLGETK